MPELGQSKTDNIPILIVHQEGVAKLLRNLNPHKATGPDQISAQLLKTNAKQFPEPLSKLFQASIDEGKIPGDWKEALVTPLFKKGDKSTPSNYRPVSLTSICSKVLEHTIHSHIMKHLDKHQILTDYQHGLGASRSCESQLLITINDIAKSMNAGEQMDAILLDFSKAFDKVSHRRLLLKLRHYGIRVNLLDWIEDILSERTQRVLVEGQHSSSAKVTSGVPQGTVMGPLLFINDLHECVKSTPRLLTDDYLLYRPIRSKADSEELQEDLDKLQKWENNWLMSFNPDKCEVIRITNKRKQLISDFYIHGKKLVTVPSAKYLGLYFQNNLSWNKHRHNNEKGQPQHCLSE